MGGQQNDSVFRQAADYIAEFCALCRVKSACRLVKNEDFRVVYECLRNADALTHAAGIGLELFAGDLGKAGQLKKLAALFLRLIFGKSLERGEIHQKIPTGEVRIIAEVLRQIAEHIAVALAEADDIFAVEAYAAAARSEHRAYHAHERCFARAVRAEQSYDLAGLEAERDIVEHLVAAIGLAQMVYCDYVLHFFLP